MTRPEVGASARGGEKEGIKEGRKALYASLICPRIGIGRKRGHQNGLKKRSGLIYSNGE